MMWMMRCYGRGEIDGNEKICVVDSVDLQMQNNEQTEQCAVLA
jgi:hypothetical protein